MELIELLVANCTGGLFFFLLLVALSLRILFVLRLACDRISVLIKVHIIFGEHFALLLHLRLLHLSARCLSFGLQLLFLDLLNIVGAHNLLVEQAVLGIR